ncbi:MAG: hypothetical protein WCX22_00460 [Methanoregula sp.]
MQKKRVIHLAVPGAIPGIAGIVSCQYIVAFIVPPFILFMAVLAAGLALAIRSAREKTGGTSCS